MQISTDVIRFKKKHVFWRDTKMENAPLVSNAENYVSKTESAIFS